MDKIKKTLDRVKGSILGNILGDAMGSPVKDLTFEQIQVKYGYAGISDFELSKVNRFQFSEYSLLAYHTARGIIINQCKKKYLGENEPYYLTIYDNIKDYIGNNSSISSREDLTVERLYNLHGDKNDCTALVRVAPFAFSQAYVDVPFFQLAMTTSITNNHPLSFLSSELLMFIILNIIKGDERSLWRVIKDSVRDFKAFYAKAPKEGLESFYARNAEHLNYFISLLDKTLLLIKHDLANKDPDINHKKARKSVASIGVGKTSEEALAIAIYCAIRYQTDTLEAIKMAVNVDGDSAAIGTVVGQIIGAYYGVNAIPIHVSDKVDFGSVSDEIVRGLFLGIFSFTPEQDKEWKEMFLSHI